MILFAILVTVLILLVIFAFAVISVGGTVFVIVFADLIVCIFIIAWVIKHFFGRKKY